MGTVRFLLALSVALSHMGGPFALFNGTYAVTVFYIISGFLICMILEGKYKKRTLLFYQNRALRIFVPYWIVVSFTWIFLWYKGIGPAAKISEWAYTFDPLTWVYIVGTNSLLFGQDWGLFLGYSAQNQLYWISNFRESPVAVYGFQAIPQAWSVSLELWFYLLAPFLLRSNSATLFLLLVACGLMRVFACKAGLDGDPWSYRFLPFELSFFLLGALAFRASQSSLYRRLEELMPRALPITIFACAVSLVATYRLAPVAKLDWHLTVFHLPLGLFVATAVALPALLRFSSMFRWDRWLGNLSYPIYLVHITVIWTVNAWGIPEYGKLTPLVFTLLAAVLICLAIERPVDRYRQRRVTQNPSPSGEVANGATS